MAAFTHTLSDGLKLQVQLKRSAKKNIILRPVSAEAISVNAPPFLSLPKLAAWLQANEPLLRQTLQRAPARPNLVSRRCHRHCFPPVFHHPP